MSRTETLSSILPDAREPIFRALLTPYRSLGPRGFAVLMGSLGAVSLLAGIAFAASGAWPVVGFFGLDVFVLWLAFRASYRSGRAREEVEVSRLAVSIRKVAPDGRSREASYNPSWTRLEVRRDAEIGVTGMKITGEGRSTEIGSFLNPPDRETFAAEFGRALATARRG